MSIDVVPDRAAAAAAVRRLVRGGFERRDLADLPQQPWELSRSRIVALLDADAERDHAPGLLAAVRGVSLVVVAADPDACAALLDDLDRAAPSVEPAPSGSPDRDALLSRLAAGDTVTAAALALHVSRRTANRWLSAALLEYGVDSTAAAVTAWAAVRRSPS